ncbi:GTP-binding protein [Marinitoga sp. 38H-ov]|uniref:GTP-binding protein n=1 Tax=Marinitoga sp. 38H-ov TaxID=1755814 RepID=UPI0013ED9E33|nr:GTP-binding protein [Marinitoga sp. 38H-ov]KAF2956277.1 adenylylsulfate kinase [Marinitoga sp. 38H-ov]
MDKIIEKQDMSIVFVGHVDHGKSTIVGRLLADTNSLPEGKLEQVKENCRRNSKPFEYAFLIDALKDEQAQGITIDAARIFFKTEKRNYIIIDAPGHIEFLKNMVTGASHAEAALLVIDAAEGVKENSKRHGYMLAMLGIKQITVLVNKMDLINYDEKIYNSIVKEYTEFLNKINITPKTFIPVSGLEGDNIASLSNKMPWYNGQTVLETLDSFETEKLPEDKPFRMPVQDVYKFTKSGDNRRIVAGTIETGKIKVGDEVIFYPSGKKSKVKTIEEFNKPIQTEKKAGQHCGFTLEEQIYVRRGEIATVNGEKKPLVSKKIKANMFWLGKDPMIKGKEYILKIGTAKVRCKIDKINMILDASTLEKSIKDRIDRHDVAEIILKTEKPIAFDLTYEIPQTSRFVIVDNYEISGGGIIIEQVKDEQYNIRDKVILRNYKWIKGDISREERAEKYSQKSTLLLITGKEGEGRKDIARALEKRLFNDGKFVYFLGIGNILYGVDADIKNHEDSKVKNREEHLRRMAEIAHIMLDSGMILIITAIELTNKDLDLIKTIVDPDLIQVIWVGEDITTDIKPDLHIYDFEHTESAMNIIKSELQEKGIIFKPW